MIKLDWLEKKDPNWIKATITNEAGAQIKDVSINRISKKGDVFPNFDSLMPGQEIEGVLWQSPKGPFYLFPPKLAATGNFRASGAISKAMEKKEASIEKFQTNKEESIKLAGAQRDAVMIVTSRDSIKDCTDEHIENEVKRWRNWFLLDEEFNNPPPF